MRKDDIDYRELVERLPVVVYVDASNEVNSAIYVSPQIEAMFGYTIENWLTDHKLWVKTLHSDDRERVLAEATRTRETGEPFKMEYRLVARDGRIVWVRDEATPVPGEDGRLERWQGVLLDISEQKEAEQMLREVEGQFGIAFDSAADGMAHMAPDGKWLKVSDKLCQTFGYEREELLGITLWDITPPEELHDSRERIGLLIEGKLRSYSAERRYIRKGGSRIWAHVSVSLARDPFGKLVYFICLIENITARKLAELVPNPLTDREIEVLRRVALGRTDPEVVQDLYMSLGTVKLDVRHILKKLEVKNRKQAVGKAIEIGLISPPPPS